MTVQSNPEIHSKTVLASLRRWADLHPDVPAVTDAETTLGYAELRALVDELEQRLASAGVGPGDRVAILGDNTVSWVLAFLAGLSAGAIVLPLNNRLSRGELTRQLRLSAPRVTLVSERLAVRAEAVAQGLSTRVLGLEADSPNSVWRLSRRDAGALPDPSAPAVISFTSGTTGEPKGATISHASLTRAAVAYIHTLGTMPGDRTLALVPLFHNTGFVDQLVQMLTVGGTLDLIPEFGVRTALDALERTPATYLIAVPSIYRLFMLHERADAAFTGCRIAAYGGSPMPESWIAELTERWPHMRLFNIYGLTEFTSVSHALLPDEVAKRSRSVGRPVEGVRHRVVDASGTPVAPGVVGEIELAGPSRMLGYWRNKRATAAAFSGAWLRTGDLGEISEDNFLTVHGRAGDVINRGGEKIHAAHLESALCEVASVGEAAVVGAPHPVFQERVVACVVVKEGQAFDESAVRAHLGEWVPDYAVPERFLLLEELPRNAAGKVDRAAVRRVAADAVAGGDR